MCAKLVKLKKLAKQLKFSVAVVGFSLVPFLIIFIQFSVIISRGTGLIKMVAVELKDIDCLFQ